MGSTDLTSLERRARRRYEWARLVRSIVGFAPALALVATAALLGRRPSSAVVFGGLMFVGGVLALWRGETLRKGVLPGVLAGVIPLATSLAANLWHGCNEDNCSSLCVPACTAGGIAAGLLVSILLARRRLRWPAWAAATGVTLCAGAMGCACVGYSGVFGLLTGFALGVIPIAAGRALAKG